MKYLSTEPFTIAVSSTHGSGSLYDRIEEFERDERRERAKHKHEFENRGVMCGLCGLGREAKIHQ